ncbi:MAG: NAD(P)-binding domain-containing protein [Thermoplasmata archaeon]|nr:NAD(P)-binding domain-containing protein [Thermoplasmata archaeon]MCI4359284.1 NAD(P)-binding domain-containing protein [Thermoplasmata archaeon]
MNVGILGSGDVGKALGRGFVARGDSVMIGSRTPESSGLTDWIAEVGARGRTGTFGQSAAFGEVLVVATNGQAVEAAIELAGAEHFTGKLVIDTTNALDFSRGMPPGLFTDGKQSLSERIQRKLPGAKVVKCFNVVPNSLMVNPKTKEGAPDMLLCGDDEGAKKRTKEILTSFGWTGVIDLGGLKEAVWLEAWVPLWVRIAGALGNYNVALKVVRA